MSVLDQFPEIKGVHQAGVSQAELLSLASHPYVTEFVRTRLEDIDTLADPNLQESIRQMEAGEVIDITPDA